MRDRPEARPGAAGNDLAVTTLRDLLDEPSLRLGAVDGEDRGLGTTVRWAQPTELPDPSPYLRGGELVCSVGTMLTDPPRCEAFVRALARSHAAGLCFGVGDVHDVVPPALVEACREHGVPLLVAPLGARFSAISEYLAERRVDSRTTATREAEVLLSRLLAGLRSHASVSTLLDGAAELLGGRIELTLGGRLVAGAGEVLPGTAGGGAEALRAPVLDDGELTWRGASRAAASRSLEQLTRVLEVALRDRDVEAALRRERIGQLLLLLQERLLDPTALTPMLQGSELEPGPLVVSAWPGGAAPLLAARLPHAVVGEAPGVTLVLTASSAEVLPAAAALSLPCGYGSAVPQAQLAQGVSQARAALELALAQGGAVGPGGLTTLEGLLEQQPAGRLEPFIDQLMTPLVASDHRVGTHHVQTLRAFLRCDGSLQRTAREQYLHVNTVRHRLSRVHELTGRNPLVFDERVALAIALWAMDRRAPSSLQSR
jgi:DNA-binding PucR family transcriptional regulator